MKNRQLMRLNKVLHKGEVKTVDCIAPGNISFLEDRHGEDKWGKWIDLDEVEFIPLTEEWLLKLGFKKNKYKTSIIEIDIVYYEFSEHQVFLINGKQGQCFEFEYNIPETKERFNLFRSFKHVHQLQNLYCALTGEELVIKDAL